MNTHARRIPRPLGRGLDARIQIDVFSFRVEDSPLLAAGSFNSLVRFSQPLQMFLGLLPPFRIGFLL